MKFFRWILFALLLWVALSGCSLDKFYFVTTVTRTPTRPPLPTNTSLPRPTHILPTKDIANPLRSGYRLSFPIITFRHSLTIAHTPGDRYRLQAGMPIDTVNFTHPELGCNWMAVIGQVFVAEDRTVVGLVVEVTGILDGLEFTRLGLTGNAVAIGPGGFEVRLADYPIISEGKVQVNLLDLTGNQVADPVFINTYTDCKRQLIVVNYAKIP